MQKETLAGFTVIGIHCRTSNQENRAVQDIPALWSRFMQENVASSIPQKLSPEVYCVYTDYEGDHNLPYTVLIGCKVAPDTPTPEGMVKRQIEAGDYQSFMAEGNLQEGAVTQTWFQIWESGLDRRFQADFEVYGELAANPVFAKVPIYVGLKS
ncbi:MAG: GyrI-like domain-containing protein [Bacteroidota bacterium]